MIKAICFDLDGVFFTPQSFQNFKKNLKKDVTDEDKINYVLYKSPEILNFKKGLISETSFWDFATRELGIQTNLEGIFKTLKDNYEVNEDVRNYVFKVREAGYKTCICSNNFETRIRELNNKFSFLNLFDIQVFSYETGSMKPDIKIFETLVNKASILPEEIAYSDDDESKLEGAKKLGINTFVYTDFPSFIHELGNLGVII